MECQSFARAGMHKREFLCVQSLPLRFEFRRAGRINFVSQNGVSHIREMHANLMRTSGLQFCANEAEAGVALQSCIMRYCSSAALNDCHFFSVVLVPRYGEVYSPRRLFEGAVYYCEILSAGCFFCYLLSQREMSGVVFCDYDKSGGIFVQSVDDTGAQLSVYPGKIAYVIHNCVYESAGIMTGRGMSDHSLWLVYNGDVSILIDYVKRYVFGKNFGVFRFSYIYFNRTAGARNVFGVWSRRTRPFAIS